MKNNTHLLFGVLLVIAILFFALNEQQVAVSPQPIESKPETLVSIHGESRTSLQEIINQIESDLVVSSESKVGRTLSSNEEESVEPNQKDEVVVKEPARSPTKHSLEISGEASYSRLDVTDVNTGASASALSNLNKGVGIKYRYKVSQKIEVSGEYRIGKTAMGQSDSTRQILDSEVTLNHAEGRLQYSPDNHFYGAAKIGKSQYIFLEPNGLNFNAAVKGLNYYGLDIGHKSYFKHFDLTANLGLNQYSGDISGAVRVINGQGIKGSLTLDSSALGVPLFLEGNYGQTTFGIAYPASSNTFQQKTEELGVKVGLKINF